MAIDTRYELAFTFEKYFVDKDTGLPLANGYIKFYKDSARSVPKDVYILTGSPPNYSYLSIGNTVNLTSYGVPVYNNNNVALYFLPYELDDEDQITDTLDLYYYEVYSEDDVLQFTREGQPNVVSESETETVLNNYVPNGQFLWHNNIPASEANEYVTGKITENITTVAPGGWTFERTTGTNVIDIVTFDRIDSVTSTNPTDNPRYKLTVKCEDPGLGGDYKDIRLKFDSVNKFNGATDYSYTFSVNNNEEETLADAQLVLIKNYGTGGSPETETVIGSFDIVPTPTQISFTFSFGSDAGKTLSTTADDDYLQLVVRLPGDEGFDISMTDAGLFDGDFSDSNNEFTSTFAPTTDNQMTYQALAGSIPVTDYFDTSTTNTSDDALPIYNADLYLPIVRVPNGLGVDYSQVGKKEEFTYYIASEWDLTNNINTNNTTNLLLAWGQQYPTADYSPLGIPFSRLQQKYWIPAINCPRYGTGAQFMTNTIPASDNNMLISNNSEGAVTNAAAETSGFTVATIHKETATYYTQAYPVGGTTDSFYLENKNPGAVTAVAAGTSGFTVTPVILTGNTLLPQITQITAATIADNPGNPGKYFTFQSYNAGAVSFYVWYQISTETDPAPGGTGIKINLVDGDSAAIIAQKTWQALNGWQETLVTTVAASSVPAGGYFTIFANPSNKFVVWYMKDGAGTQPVVASSTFIKVKIVTGDTAAQVATKTQIAMNSQYFAVPGYNGWFFRAWDNGAGNDPNAATRFSYVPGLNTVTGDVIGTFQLDQNQSHLHTGGTGTDFLMDGGISADLTVGGGAGTIFEFTAAQGGAETRTKNMNVLVAIRY